MRWVKRNRDMPHRCPECHSIPDRARGVCGPRTAISCARCGVKWRMGVRNTNEWDRYVRRLLQRREWLDVAWRLRYNAEIVA